MQNLLSDFLVGKLKTCETINNKGGKVVDQKKKREEENSKTAVKWYKRLMANEAGR